MVDRLKRIPLWGVYGLLAYMPFHIFLSQSLSLITGGLNVWKVAKDVLTAGLTLLVVILIWSQRKSTETFNWFIMLAAAYGLLHLLIWAINPGIYRDSAILGTVYNNRLIWYLLIGMGTYLLLPKDLKIDKIVRLVLIVSTIVCLLGVLQYFLPKDLLTHVGYSVARGVKPAFFIDDKPDLPRIMSTLRDPNSLGGYLIVPITLIVYKLLIRRDKRQMLLGGLLLLHGLALFLTFSRSAWLGALLSVGILLSWQYKSRVRQLSIKYWPLILGVVLLGGSLLLTMRHQYFVQNVIEHSDKSTSLPSSNVLHVKQAELGLEWIKQKPLGQGPGTAGLVSVHNSSSLITENYYIQIGYEVGILGLALFLAINVFVYKKLLAHSSGLTAILLASFWGYVVMNMLLHTWSNEAVAVQWWLLAGLALAAASTKSKVTIS